MLNGFHKLITMDLQDYFQRDTIGGDEQAGDGSHFFYSFINRNLENEVRLKRGF
jgi:hypothetical protein